jgi:maltokinase
VSAAAAVPEPRSSSAVVPLPASSHPALRELVAAFVARQARWAHDAEPGDTQGPEVTPESVVIRSTDLVRPGRPGLVSVVAEASGMLVHAVLGLRAPGDEAHFLDDADESPLGILEDDGGLAVVFDVTADAELARRLLEAVGGPGEELERVRRVTVTADTMSLTFDDRQVLTVFQQLPPGGGPHPGLELFLGLDSVGFNHLLAPLALWRRDGADLGIVQEYEAGSTGGWTLALTSLRDLYASGGAPEAAGGDFAAEARRLGTMTARMHLGLDQAFGRKMGDVVAWVDAVERAVRAADPGLLEDTGVAALLADLRSSPARCAAIRTHGDFHLGRVSRTDLGWFVLDFSPGGTPVLTAGVVPTDGPVFRSPLADVADMLWSFHHVADVAATERDPSGLLGLSELAQAWEVRNRRAFLAGYLATPGIGGLVPPVRDVVRKLAAAFELERSASKLALRI